MTDRESGTDGDHVAEKLPAPNATLILQGLFLIATTVLATSILVCADMARGFRQADVAGAYGGQAMYAAASNLYLLEQQEEALNRELRTITNRYVEAVSDLDRLSRLEYAARVQFRRILFQCYYAQYIRQVESNEALAPDKKLGVLTQRFLGQVYGDINKDPSVSPNCSATGQNQVDGGSKQTTSNGLEIIRLEGLAFSTGTASRLANTDVRDYCDTKPGISLTPVQAKECSYSNVITYVSLHEGAKKRLEDLNGLKQTLSDQITALKAQREADPALRNPASLETTRLLLSFLTLDDARGLSCEADCSSQPTSGLQAFLLNELISPIERAADYLLRTLLTAPALALTILLSITAGAVGGAYRSAWVKYSALEDEAAFLGVKDSLLLGAFLGAAVGLLTWLGLMTTGAVVGGEEGPAANLDPKLLAAIAVTAGLANREAMQFLVSTAQNNSAKTINPPGNGTPSRRETDLQDMTEMESEAASGKPVSPDGVNASRPRK